MKICLLAFGSLATEGSDETRQLKEMRSLAEAGFEVSAIGLRLTNDLPEYETYYGAQIHRVKPTFDFDRQLQREIPKRSLLGSIKRLYTLTIKNTLGSGLALFKTAWKRDADIYHCFGIYALVPGFFLRIFKRKMVTYDAYEVPHESIAKISALGLFAKPLSSIVGSMETCMAAKAECVFSIPSANDKYADRFKKRNKQVVVLRNAPPSDWKTINDSALSETYSGCKVLLYMGAFVRTKGIMQMIQAYQLIHEHNPNTKLVLVGSFDTVQAFDEIKKEAISFIHNNNLQENIVITGRIPWQKVPKYLGIADVALHLYQPLPVLMESQGSSSFFEYMGASLPIVASDFPGVGSIVRKYNCGLTVDPTNIQEAAEAIAKLLDDSKLAIQLGKNARSAFDQEFNWCVEEEKLLAVYGEMEKGIKK